MRFWPAIRLVALVALLAVTAGLGLWEGARVLRDGATTGQRIASAGQLVYGVLAALTLIALLARRPRTTALMTGWGAAVTFVGALAPVVWGGAPLGAGAAAGAATAGVVALAVWGAKRHLAGSAGRAGRPAVDAQRQLG